jgi:hypothetical protein
MCTSGTEAFDWVRQTRPSAKQGLKLCDVVEVVVVVLIEVVVSVVFLHAEGGGCVVERA